MAEPVKCDRGAFRTGNSFFCCFLCVHSHLPQGIPIGRSVFAIGLRDSTSRAKEASLSILRAASMGRKSMMIASRFISDADRLLEGPDIVRPIFLRLKRGRSLEKVSVLASIITHPVVVNFQPGGCDFRLEERRKGFVAHALSVPSGQPRRPPYPFRDGAPSSWSVCPSTSGGSGRR